MRTRQPPTFKLFKGQDLRMVKLTQYKALANQETVPADWADVTVFLLEENIQEAKLFAFVSRTTASTLQFEKHQNEHSL